jgi:predicted DNA-binding protein
MTSIRVPLSALEKIDELRKKRVGNVSRNTWILEAIEDKIEREGG